MEQVPDPSSVIVRIQAASLRNYIYWSTLIGVFSVILVIRVPIAIRLFDVIMLTNLILMLLLGYVVRISARMLCFILYLAVSGGIGIFHGTDTIALVAKEFLGISVSALYFYYFFRMIGNDFERTFSTYATIAFWFAVIALPIWAGACIYLQEYVRLRGLTAEPTAFCDLVLPAYYWYTYQYFTSRRYGARVAVFTLAIILTDSTNGYVCVMFGAILLLSGRLKYLVAIPLVLGGIIGLAYTFSADFRLRINDTLHAALTQDLRGANFSTYAIMSNLFVTQQVLKESPIIGNGLGSHPISHARFLADIPGVGVFVQTRGADLNAPDAGSLTLRSLSELGILGFLGELIFVFYFRVGGSGARAAISNAILVVFFLKLLRDGHYFPTEQFFFIFTYMLNYRQHKLEVRKIPRRVSSRLQWCP
jgi:hypothetical protein